MAKQGKCKKCKTHYVFRGATGNQIDVKIKLGNIHCPVCKNSLRPTSNLSQLPKVDYQFSEMIFSENVNYKYPTKEGNRQQVFL